MQDAPAIVWIRRDFRLQDNPALHRACEHGCPVIPVFIWAPEEAGSWTPGGASKWWLHHSLEALQTAFDDAGCRLIIRKGKSLEVLESLIEETGAGAVFWNTRYEPAGRAIDQQVADKLGKAGVEVHMFAGCLLHQPDLIKTGSGTPYQVFTPFWKKLKSTLEVPSPLPAPERIPAFDADEALDSVSIADLALLPEVDWAGGIRDAWTPGEDAAHKRLAHFIDEILLGYEESRDMPAEDGTSQLSPYLHFGEISPRQIWHAVIGKQNRMRTHEEAWKAAADSYLREIGWREFSYHLLHHFPETPEENLKSKFDDFEWCEDEEALERWQKGQTGYPIVDAGMRQLWATGWMHNRVRMIVASLLTKHLLTHWSAGADWFWDTLVDADLANNTMGWQWSAGSGADAQPFFRIFNPITQAERFDPDGLYIEQWVPELAGLPLKHRFTPWDTPPDVQKRTGFKPGKTYPLPIVEHKPARERALAAYEKIK